MTYYVPAYIGLVIASMGLIGLPVHLAAYRERGVLLGAVLPTARAAQGAGVLLWFVMLMISGAGPPPEVLNATLTRVADATPLKHVILVLQDPWLGFGSNAAELLVVAGILVLSALLALRLFRWE